MINEINDSPQQHCHPQTVATSADALQSITATITDRKQAIRDRLADAGQRGMLRHELAAAIGIELSSVCGLITPMVRSGNVVELGDARPTRTSRAAKILRLPEFVDAPAIDQEGATR